MNGIPGYFALWLTSLASLYNHSGDLDFLRSQHDALLRVLAAMDASLDRSGAFTNRKGQWLFVDWAPDLYGYTPRAILGTSLQYLRGYRAAARLLDALNDHTHAEQARLDASRLQQSISSASGSHTICAGPKTHRTSPFRPTAPAASSSPSPTDDPAVPRRGSASRSSACATPLTDTAPSPSRRACWDLRGRAAPSPRRTASFTSLCVKRRRTNESRSRFRPVSRRRLR